MTSALALVLAAAAVATSDPPHAAADVFDQDYGTQAECRAALDQARTTASAQFRRLLSQAECGPRSENGQTRFHVHMRWKRSPLTRPKT